MIRIFVGNLSPFSSESDIRELFSRWGSVQLFKVPKTRANRNGWNYVVIEMNEEEAQAAIVALDGVKFNGRALRVSSLVGC